MESGSHNCVAMEDVGEVDASLLLGLPPDLFLLCFTASCASPRFVSPRDCRYAVRRIDEDRFPHSEDASTQSALLSFRDWSRLDVALTNRRLRTAYLQSVKGARIEFSPRAALQDWSSFSRWVSSRAVSLVSLALSPAVLAQLSLPLPFSLAHIAALQSPTPRRDQLHTLSLVLRRLPSLTSARFDNNQRVNASTLRALLQGSPRLAELSLAACKHVNDAALRKIERHGRALCALDLSKCKFSAQSLAALLVALPRLLLLDLSSCRVSLLDVATSLRCVPLLQALHLRHLQHSERGKETESDCVDALVQSLGPRLVALSLDGMAALSDAHLVLIGSSCPGLLSLSLQSCSALSAAALAALSLPRLQALDLRNCVALADDAAVALSHSLSRCTDVAVDGCFRLTAIAIRALRAAPRDDGVSRPMRVTHSHCPRVDLEQTDSV